MSNTITNCSIEELIYNATHSSDNVVKFTKEIEEVVKRIADKSGFLTAEDEKTLILISQKTDGFGDNIMYLKQLPSIEKICKSFAYHHKSKQELSDYIHDCYFSVSDAMKNYKLGSNTRFNTYMSIYVKKDLNENWYKGIHCSKYYQQQNHIICEFCDEFEKSYGRIPNDTEIATALGYSLDRIKTIRREALKCSPIYFEEIVSSSDDDLFDNDGTKAIDEIYLDSSLMQESPEAVLIRNEMNEEVNIFLDDIGPLRTDVISRSLGIGMYNKPQSREQIVRETGLTTRHTIDEILKQSYAYGCKKLAEYR